MAARPPAFSLESTINHEGPFCSLPWLAGYGTAMPKAAVEDQRVRGTYNLVKTLGSTKTRWAHANDEDVDVAAFNCVN